MNKKAVQEAIVRRLVNKNMWGGKHTEHVCSGLPKHLLGNKETTEALKELISKHWIVPQLKTRETHYSLNPQYAKEIKSFLENN